MVKSAGQTAAKDLTSDQWPAKFAAVKLKDDGKTPLYGEITRVAALDPAVSTSTFHSRWKAACAKSTTMGPPPSLGPLEELLYAWLLKCESWGVHVTVAAMKTKALEVAKVANIGWEFKATDTWVNRFCHRHGVKLREGQ
jgi:hypothetical protein